MTDAWDYDESDNQQNGPKALRDAYKAQKDVNEKLMDRLNKLEAESNRNRVADMFESQGVPRGAAKYYNGDTDPEKVNAYVTEMRAAFGGASVPQTESVPAPSTDEQLKLQNLMQAGANGDPGTNFDIAQSKLNDPNLSQAERIAAWQEFARLQK